MLRFPVAAAAIAAAVLATSPWAVQADDYVCQVMMPVDQPLQDTLGIECNVTNATNTSWGNCTCNSTFWDSLHPTWQFITPLINRSMAHDAHPGFWYLTDTSGRCGASFGDEVFPSTLSCPPGFYCAGGLDPPRSCDSGDHCPGETLPDTKQCPSGYFCPFPAAPLERCQDGAVCRAGSTRPNACDAGSYCVGGIAQICPRGYYCPFACAKPVKCTTFKFCPEGSSHEDGSLIAAVFMIIVIVLLYIGAAYYHRFVQSGLRVGAALTAMITLMAIVDHTIAGFLALNVIAIAANYTLLKFGALTRQAARLLLCLSLLTALIVLWTLNPAWSMLCAGLLLCFLVGWLMTRETFAYVVVGRSLLVVVFVALLFSFAHVDPEFLLWFGLCVLGCAAYLTVKWFLEEQLESWRARVPFATRWPRDIPPLQQSLSPAITPSGSFIGLPDSTAAAVAPGPLPMVGNRLAAAPNIIPPEAGAQARRRGVSFELDSVGFNLHDGTPLLRDINMRIAPGRRVAVMGASGSGKTTLLAVLSGRASYGEVVGKLLVGGEPADDLRFLRHSTGYVPQDDILHGELTVEENIRFQAKLRLDAHTAHEEIESRVNGVVEDLHLTRIIDSRVGTPEKRGVSGGQRKRVSIAMELVTEPLLLFADEPTSGLDSTTAHEVVGCLNGAAERSGTTVLSVIHQPRYETLLLFDDLVLLATGGKLVYAGPTATAMQSFKDQLNLHFPANANPADVMLDAIQPPNVLSEESLASLRTCGASSARGSPMPLERPTRDSFSREIPPFFQAVLILFDRAMLQTMRAYAALITNQVLCVTVILLLCSILKNSRIEDFLMQSNLAALFLMLLQAVAAQRIFGPDLLVTLREARVGMSMIAFLVAKDLASLFEITLSAAVFASCYGTFSGVQQPVTKLFSGAWAFVYSVYGLSYNFSILLSPGAAQMTAVVAAFMSFCVSGVYQPQLQEMAGYLGGRGWMVPVLSPVRWFWGEILTAEMHYLTPLSRKYGRDALAWRGYDLEYLDGCSLQGIDTEGTGVVSLRQAWLDSRGWVCSVVSMLLLGIIFRFLAGICLILYMHAQTSRWAQFFGQSEKGVWKLLGQLFTLLVGSFLLLLLFAEVWIFGIQSIDIEMLLQHLGFLGPT